MLIGADIPQAEPMRSAYLSLSLETEDDAERVYALFADGGEIFMKMRSAAIYRLLGFEIGNAAATNSKSARGTSSWQRSRPEATLPSAGAD